MSYICVKHPVLHKYELLPVCLLLKEFHSRQFASSYLSIMGEFFMIFIFVWGLLTKSYLLHSFEEGKINIVSTKWP